MTAQLNLHIVILALGMPFNEKTVNERSLGGSESAAYYQARELARRGYRVDLWTSIDTDSVDELGVRYTAAGRQTPEAPMGERFERWAQTTPHDVLIIQRHPLAFHKQWAASVCLWQLHDLAAHRVTGAIYQGLWQTNAITCVSEWHKKQVLEVWGLKPEAVHVVPNGVDHSLYTADTPIHPETARLEGKFVMLYQSRPERGLEHLVRPGGIMDRLRDINVHLLVCAYANTVPQMALKYAQLDAMAKALPNVTQLGALTKVQLAHLQKYCDLLCYPTEFEEVSCITAMEAMHAGLPMLTTDAGALKETCGKGTRIVELLEGKVDEDAFVAVIKDRIGDDETQQHDQGHQRGNAVKYTWVTAVDKLEQLIVDQFRNARTADRIVRHGFEHSDLELASDAASYVGPTVEQYRELALYDFSKTTEGYAAHYAKHQGAYYDSHEQNVIGEDVTGTTRFVGVISGLATRQLALGNTQDGAPVAMRVLDYGCAHGHYTMKLAKMLPQCEFFGIDISERAIAAALKWAVRDDLRNVTLAIGGLEHADEWAMEAREFVDDVVDPVTGEGTCEEIVHDMRFDAIIAGEVLEHVPDPYALAQRLLNLLKPGGVLIGTTPTGRWEWTGTAAFREAREHLWHFTKQDLEYMFDDYVKEIGHAGAGADRTGALLGSYVFTITQHELARVRRPNIEQRMTTVVPRQTISACLIVKDGEQTLRRCVTSFIDWVDEIIIAIDPTTTDRTQEIIDALRKDFPLKYIGTTPGTVAVKDGFDFARNVTLECALGDWVLWLDADEEVQQPWNLWKYARNSAIDGIGLPQIHYSCNPPQVLTTDFPTRFFRRSSGAKFFGVVHEHPETETGKAIPHSLVRHDVQFLHNGYVDEITRRKRFDRNMPLLKRDIEEYPNRVLNQFLILRDITQGIMFDLERNGGNVTESHAAEARKGVELFNKLLGSKQHMRLLIDALEFYSQCVMILGEGFEAKFEFEVTKPGAESLTVKSAVKGRFKDRATYFNLLQRFAEESTKHYESKHL